MGEIDCANIAKVNWKDKEQVKNFYSNPESRRLRVCTELNGEMARVLGSQRAGAGTRPASNKQAAPNCKQPRFNQAGARCDLSRKCAPARWSFLT